MHLMYAIDCVLTLRVPITGIQLLSGIEKLRSPSIGGGEIDGLPGASTAELLVTNQYLS